MSDFMTKNSSTGNQSVGTTPTQSYVIIGLPLYSTTPSLDGDDINAATISYPYVDVIPYLPTFNKNAATSTDLQNLVTFNVETSEQPLRIYFEPTSFSDTFTNTLANSFVSSMFSETSKLGQSLQQLGIDIGPLAKSLGNELTNFVNQHGGGISNNGSSVLKKLVTGITEAPAGYLYMFPKIWGGSNAQLSYTIKTRLICNNPGSDSEYTDSILTPIEKLLRLSTPRKDPTINFYRWPYFVSATCKGLFGIKYGMITNVEIEKGAHNSLSYNQRPSIIDINITFTSIYDAVLLDDTATSPSNLQDYINVLGDSRTLPTTSSSSTPPQTTAGLTYQVQSTAPANTAAQPVSPTTSNMANSLPSSIMVPQNPSTTPDNTPSSTMVLQNPSTTPDNTP